MGRRWGRTDQPVSDNCKALDVDVACPGVEVSLAGYGSRGDSIEVPRPDDVPAMASVEHLKISCPSASSSSVTEVQSVTTQRSEGLGPFKVWWIEKLAERTFERREGSLRLDEPVPVLEKSEAAAEYRCRITAYYLRTQGWGKDKIAEKLQRALGWVTLWWEKAPEEAPRPWDVPKYVADYNLRMLQCGMEPFRPAVLRRRYMTDTAGLYDECAQKMPWRQAVFRKRNYETGGVTVTSIPSSRQDSSYTGLTTGIARLDEALDRVRHDFNITDPRVYLLNNFYPDGNTSIAPHTHDFWSAILSFGASRVFTVDGHPLLLGDGDLLVIGTQRHAVPKMPDVKDGRVSVAIFWYPENRHDFWPALDGSGCAQCGRPRVDEDGTETLQEAHDGNSYCQECFLGWQAESGNVPGNSSNSDEVTEDDLLAAALEMSLTFGNVPGNSSNSDEVTEDDLLAAALEMSLTDR